MSYLFRITRLLFFFNEASICLCFDCLMCLDKKKQYIWDFVNLELIDNLIWRQHTLLETVFFHRKFVKKLWFSLISQDKTLCRLIFEND